MFSQTKARKKYRIPMKSKHTYIIISQCFRVRVLFLRVSILLNVKVKCVLEYLHA